MDFGSSGSQLFSDRTTSLCGFYHGIHPHEQPPFGCFLKWWYPQKHPKMIIFSRKPMVVGYHHFRKPLFGIICLPFFPTTEKANLRFLWGIKGINLSRDDVCLSAYPAVEFQEICTKRQLSFILSAASRFQRFQCCFALLAKIVEKKNQVDFFFRVSNSE